MGGGVFVSVVVGRMLARLFRVVLGMRMMTVRYVGVVTGFLMVPRGMVLGGGAVVFRGMLVMLSGFQVMLFTFFGHRFSFPS